MSGETKRIRQTVVSMLKDGDTLAQDRVFPSRSTDVDERLLPCLLVFTDSLTEENKGNGDSVDYEGEVQLVIQVLAKETVGDTANCQAEDLADEVKDVLLKNPDSRTRLDIEGVPRIETRYGVIGEGNTRRATALMKFQLKLGTEYPPTFTDELLQVHIKTDAIDPHDSNIHAPSPQYPDGYGSAEGPDHRIEVESDVVFSGGGTTP